MALDTVGILTPIDFPLEQPTQISAIMREIFVNEAPLFARLNHRQATSEVYTIDAYNVRQRTYTLGAGDLTNVATTLPIADASPFLVGDVLELDNGTSTERVEVTAAPNLAPTPNTLTIRRGREGTTGTAFLTAAPTTIRLVGNSRTGGEVDQQGHRPVVTQLQQIVQTMQFPVQVGGKAEAISNVALPPGVNSVMGRDRAIAALEFVRDVEYYMYYGKGEVPAASGDRGKMKGLKTLIGTFSGGANVVTNAGASYTRAAFLAATAGKIYAQGGLADIVLCSTDFLGFLDTWVPNKTAQMGAGATNALGFPITTFVLPLNAQPMTFVPSLQLRPGTAAVLSSNDLEVRVLREMFWSPRGIRGDAMMGDWIGDYAINVNRPQYHAWVEGITSAA
jgi:hypothetical protein